MFSKVLQRSVIGGVCLFGSVAFAADGPDKSAYHLFNPTPREMMRDLSTDRPDKTESAYTVDAGHFQIEADLFSFTHNRDNSSDTTTKVSNFSVMNLKAGLTNDMDLQLMLSPYRKVEENAAGVTSNKEGFAETVLRLKWNVFGNEGTGNAMALMPFLKLPTASNNLNNNQYEGGLIIPFAVEMPHDLGLGIMFQANRMKNANDDQFHTKLISSITMSSAIVGSLGGYAELYSESSAEPGASWIATGDLGLTYGLTPNLQLDLGANIGLTDAADDINGFLGFAARF